MLLIDTPPNLIQEAVLQAIYQQTDITANIVDTFLNGFGIKSEKYYRYGRDYFYLGLPDGTIQYTPPREGIIKEVLKIALGKEVILDTVLLAKTDPDYMVFEFLRDNRGWNEEDYTVENPPFVLEEKNADTRFSYPKITYSDVTFDHAAFREDGNIDVTYSYFTYTQTRKIDNNDGRKTSTYPTSVEENSFTEVVGSRFPRSKIIYHISYYDMNSRGEATGEKKYWFYDYTEGTYAALNLTKEDLVSSYFPIVPIRANYKDLSAKEVRDTEAYRTSRRCLDKLGINFADMGAAVHESPEISKVASAYVMLGIDIQSKEELSIKYLYEFFNGLVGGSRYKKSDYLRWLRVVQDSPPPMNTITISDGGYNMDLSYLYIESTLVDGVIGAVGTTTRENEINPRYAKKRKIERKERISYKEIFSFETSVIYFRHQISATQYREVEVFGPYHENLIYSYHIKETSLEQSLDSENDQNNFIIPLDRNIIKSWKPIPHSMIIYDATRVVFNTLYTQKLKWYQTAFFQFIVLVIAIIITIYTAGGASGWVAGISNAYAAGGAIAAATVIATMVVKAVAFSYLAKLAADEVGAELTLVIAVVAMAYGAYSQAGSAAGLPFATEMLAVSNALISGVQASVEEDLDEINSELTELAEKYDELMEEIEEENADKGYIDPIALVQEGAYLTSYDSIDNYFTRAIHVGNIGAYSLDTVESYVSTKLRLDKKLL